MRWVIAIVSTVAALKTAAADVAADDARQAAALFEQGRQAFAARRIDDACEAFSASLGLDPQLGTRLNLAACRAEQGRLVEAYALFVAAQGEAEQSGKPARATYAKEQIALLEGKLVRLHLVVTSAPDVTVRVNGAPIDPARRQLLEPGQISIDVNAPGRRPYHVQKLATAGAEITVDVPALEIETPAEGVKALPIMLRPPAVPPERHARSVVPYIVGGAGGLLGVTAGALTLHARSRWGAATDARDRDGVTSAQHEADVATMLAIGGTVALAAGIVLWVRDQPPVGERVGLVPTRSGIAVTGSF